MASLPHAPFASSNNTQSSPLLPSPLPMDHSPHNPHQYDQLWHAHLEKPPSYNPSHIIGSLGFTPHSNEKLYAGLLGNPQEQFLIAAGGEVSLLTSSWEALDKLVSANCMSTGSMNEVSDNLNCLIMGVQDGNILGSSPTYSEVEQKPSNLYGASNSKSSNGGGRIMWVPATPTSHAASACSIEKKNAGLNLAKFSADPGFADRAAKFSSYSQQMNQAYSINNVSLDSNLPTRKLGSPASNSPIKTSPVVAAPDNAMAEEPSINEGVLIIKPCIPSKNNEGPPQRSMTNHGKKKRAGSKDVDMDDKGNGKRPKSGESVQISEIKAKSVLKPQQSTSGNSGDSEQKSGKQTSKASDAPKQDFIHVRARRGQATDSHSLAERVRREKISERMKYLQDLVPGCSKVTGKAVMLDEIINYVQSLQRQVEFLSMKLAAVHPSKLEFNLENLFGKEVVRQPISQNQNNVATLAPESNNINSYNPSFNRHDNLQINSSLQLVGNLPCNSRLVDVLHSFGSDGAALRRAVSSLDISSDTFGSDCISQITQAWADDDLQNVVQNMGFAQTSLLQVLGVIEPKPIETCELFDYQRKQRGLC